MERTSGRVHINPTGEEFQFQVRQDNYAAMVEMCLKLYPHNPHMQRLITETNRQLA
jgi:hypothetical protein